jgi:TatD DNase family protein
MGKVAAVCTSPARGTPKTNVGRGEFVPGHGIRGDAHAGPWHRQVSLLSSDKIDAFRAQGADIAPGAFGENLVVEGIDFRNLPVGTILRCGEVTLEMTQIGKECHSRCAIYGMMGDCIMPREGVFARVLRGGVISVGDLMETDRAKGASGGGN